MKRFFPILPFLVLFLLFLSSFVSVQSNAQTSPSPSISTAPSSDSNTDVPQGPPIANQTDNGFSQFTTCPPQFDTKDADKAGLTSDCPSDPSGNYITDLTPKVVITFPGLAGLGLSKDNTKICFRHDFCTSDLKTLTQPSDKILSYLHTIGFDNDFLKHANDPDDVGFDFNTFQITVCGRGDGDLFAGKKCDPKNGNFFHAGHSYLITVYSRQSDDDNWIAVAFGGFYVNHGIPHIDLTPYQGYSQGVKWQLSITQPVLRSGGSDNNNYQVVLNAPGQDENEKQSCGVVKNPNSPLVFSFPIPQSQKDVSTKDAHPDSGDLLKNGYTLPGTYIFKINEQINDGSGHTDACQGGHTYMQFTCALSNDVSKNKCTSQPDPNGDDANHLLELLNQLSGNNKGAQLPCNGSKKYVSNPLDCPSLDTAIGSIPLDPVGFISKLLAIVLSFAGAVAVLILIYSGYRLLLSRGDKEKIQQARDKITSTVIGLIFIVFSLVLLSVIAGDILKIPGFK